MNSRVLSALLITACAFVLSRCVETETKRTTKKVDASRVEVYQTDMNRPRARLALDIPDYIEVNIQNMLFVEIDDGEHRYGFGGNVFSADSAGAAGMLYSPWINTPDSGELTLSFRLAYETGANIVDDRMSIELRPDWFWIIEFGITDHDPCEQWPEAEVCRTYSLPRDVESSGDGQLLLVWRGYPIAVAEQ